MLAYGVRTGDPLTDTSLLELAEALLADMAETSPRRTYDAYRTELRSFLAWQAGRKWEDVLQEYFSAHPAWTVSTARIKRARINRFIKFINGQGHRIDAFGNILPLRPRRSFSTFAPKVVDSGDISMVFSMIPVDQLRDAVFFRLLYSARFRVSEAASLKVKDIIFHGGPCLSILSTRRQKTLETLIEDQWLADQLPILLKDQQEDQFVFRAKKHGCSGPLKQQSMHKRWKYYAQQAGVVCSMEDLRISAVQQLVDQRISEATLLKILGLNKKDSLKPYVAANMKTISEEEF